MQQITQKTISDFNKNKNEFYIIDSTLREGEQFINSNFSTDQKIKIAQMLSDFGIEYLELTNPSASENSYTDCKEICNLTSWYCKAISGSARPGFLLNQNWSGT